MEEKLTPRQRYDAKWRKQQSEKSARLHTVETQMSELYTICNTQQDEIDTLKAEVTALRDDVNRLMAKADAFDRLQEDFDALELENRRLAAENEELRARLGLD